MISAIGAVIGILVGLLLCWIQQTYGIVHLGESEGSFIVNAYPVSVHPQDIVVIFFTVLPGSQLPRRSAFHTVHILRRAVR